MYVYAAESRQRRWYTSEELTKIYLCCVEVFLTQHFYFLYDENIKNSGDWLRHTIVFSDESI